MRPAKYEIESDLGPIELKDRLKAMFTHQKGFPSPTAYVFGKPRIDDRGFKVEVNRRKDQFLSIMVRGRWEPAGKGSLLKLRVAYPNYILYGLWAICLLVCFLYVMVWFSESSLPVRDLKDVAIVGPALLFSFFIPWNTRRQTRKFGEIFLYILCVNGIARQYGGTGPETSPNPNVSI